MRELECGFSPHKEKISRERGMFKRGQHHGSKWKKRTTLNL
jgi:hypothetical protein